MFASHRVCARGPTVRGEPDRPSATRGGTGDERTPSENARRRVYWGRRRLLQAPAGGTEPFHLLADLPEAARPHGGDRGGEAAAAAVAAGVRTVLGKDVAHRRRGECGCEDLGDAVDLVARLPGHGRGPHQPSCRSDRPASRAGCLPRRPARECPTLAVPRSTVAPLASARSVLIGAADRPDPIKATKRRARNAPRATVGSPVHPRCAGSCRVTPDTQCSVPVTRCRCKPPMHVHL
jgi:hypothetical protein